VIEDRLSVGKLFLAMARGTVVCEGYIFSGVAFSASNVDPSGTSLLSLEWCGNSDIGIGLSVPELALFFDITSEKAKEQRGAISEGRNGNLIARVTKFFHQIGKATDGEEQGGETHTNSQHS
jgi:dTMP kinase